MFNPLVLIGNLLVSLFGRVRRHRVGTAPAVGNEGDSAQVVPLEPRRRRRAATSGGSARKGEGQEPLEVSRCLAPEAAAVPQARGALEPLAPAVDPAAFGHLRLLVTELVSNAVRHGTRETYAPIELSVVAAPHRVRAEVIDRGSGFTPPARSEGDDQASGWGLHLVEQLSDRWGLQQNGRTVVWFEIGPELWLSDHPDYVTSPDARSGAFPEKGEAESTALPGLGAVRSLFAGRSEPEADVD
jgi:Histidine kinase-like ATPase domain